MRKLRLALILTAPIVLLTGRSAIAQNTSPLFRETFRGNVLENLGAVNYQITTSRDSTRPANDPLGSQSVCLTASQDTTNTVPRNQTNAINLVPGCAPGLSGLPITGDASGAGALRLTSNRRGYIADDRRDAGEDGQGERGAFIIDSAFPRGDGLVVEFDFFIYNGDGNPPSADGISFFLLDGNTPAPIPGAFGGSLGYAQATQGGVQSGASNGFIGIGFDVFGNFSLGTEGRVGGAIEGSTVRQPDQVVLRGSATKGYPFIKNVNASSVIGRTLDDKASIANPQTRSQGNVQGRRARITITPEGFLTVGLSTQTGENIADTAFINVFSDTIDLKQAIPIVDGVDALAPIPSTFKFGFAASTGFSTAIHELRNLIIRPIVNSPRNLRLVKRVTAIIRKGIRTEFNTFTDDRTTPVDNAPGWSQPGASPVGLINLDPTLAVQSNDEVEYTIYYLAEGTNGSIADVNICDPVPPNSTFISNTNQISRNNTAAISSGTFFNKLQPIPATTPCPTGQNPNGTILYSLGNLATNVGQNFGYTRFRTRVDGN